MKRIDRRQALATAAAFSAAALAGAVPALAQQRPRLARIDAIAVFKRQRRMVLLQNGEFVRQYRVQLGSNPIGHKQEQGDGRTPEGLYAIDGRRTESNFGLALHVSYPNARDVARARSRGVSPGGAIYIHGQPWEARFFAAVAYRIKDRDWTDGCIAVSDAEMAEIFAAVRDGTPIVIRP